MSNGLKQDISLGPNLKALRKKNGLLQKEVSAQLEIMGIPMTEDILAKIEQGRYSVKISVLLALKKIYKVDTFDEIFAGLYQQLTPSPEPPRSHRYTECDNPPPDTTLF
ncbi:MAG: helix-turn-helix transcriptional regulator [Lawsonibacter sp.]|nr:helix-turn-helix transcriptional regulator [Lawsonibacter sp.]